MKISKLVSLFVFFVCSMSTVASAQKLIEDGMTIEEVDKMFTFTRTEWRDLVFERRKAGKQAEDWAWDTVPQQDGDTETIMFAQWQEAFDQFGVNLLQISPTYESETKIRDVEFIWRFFPKLERWPSLDMQNLCEAFLQKSKTNLSAKYTLFERCWTTLHQDLETVAFEMSATVWSK